MTSSLLIEALIVDLAEHSGRIITRRQLGNLGEAGATLRHWGALQEDETLTSIACNSCGDDHFVELEFDQESRQWRYFCSAVGFVPVHDDELATYRFSLDWLMDRLVELLAIRRPEKATLIDGVMWRLGVARIGLRFWTAVVARDVVAHLDPVLAQLQRAGRDHGGLVLTSSAEVPFRVPLPNGYRWLPLRDLLGADGDELRAQEGAIRGALAGAAGRSIVERPRGRAGVKSLVLSEFHRRGRVGEVEPTLQAEASVLRSWLVASHPDTGGRSLGTIENIIRSAHAAWREQNPRPTK